MTVPPVNVRTLGALGAAACVLSLAIAYFFMELYLGLEACPLCILDRFVVGLMAAAFLAHALLGAGRRKAHFALMAANAAFLAAGYTFSLRHIYLQNRPLEELPLNCLADSEAARGLIELVERAFDANADCGVIAWEFLGMSIPVQVLLLFVALTGIVALQLACQLLAGRTAGPRLAGSPG